MKYFVATYRNNDKSEHQTLILEPETREEYNIIGDIVLRLDVVCVDFENKSMEVAPQDMAVGDNYMPSKLCNLFRVRVNND